MLKESLDLFVMADKVPIHSIQLQIERHKKLPEEISVAMFCVRDIPRFAFFSVKPKYARKVR